MTRYRNLFWPGVLILIGVLALLVNTNLISPERLYRLTDLWPLLLIVIGLLMLLRRMPLPATTSAVAGGPLLFLAAPGALASVGAGPPIPGGVPTPGTPQPPPGISSGAPGG